MNPYSILMLIFGACIFLYGACVMVDKHPLIPKYYKKTITKSYRFYIGKTLMLVSCSPILSALIACLGTSTFITILSIITLIASFILLMYIATHKFKGNNEE
ncbi:MAG: hypothetical protein IKF71_00860 [Bacilli bacterium]|nr:hypothetical protein [Bacilli bacterium]